jgi:hypothetical protein
MGCPVEDIGLNRGLRPSLSQNSDYEFQQFPEFLKRSLPVANRRALLLFALFPLSAHGLTPLPLALPRGVLPCAPKRHICCVRGLSGIISLAGRDRMKAA